MKLTMEMSNVKARDMLAEVRDERNDKDTQLFNYQGRGNKEQRQTRDKLNFQPKTTLANNSTQGQQTKIKTKWLMQQQWESKGKQGSGGQLER